MATKKIDVDEAFSALRQYYFQFVQGRCVIFLDGCLDLIKHDEVDEDTARENLSQVIEDACIYNRDNAITLCASDNDSAYVDNFGADGVVEGGSIRYDRLAYAALEADIMETLDRAGFDWDDIEESTKPALEWFAD
jgi:hypothetical protein